MFRGLRIAALAALGTAALLLAGCSSEVSKQAKMTCPKVMSAPETQTIALFGPTGHEPKDVMVGGRIRDIDSHCQPEKVGIEVLTNISFEAQRANMGITDATFPYFVAILDSNGHVLDEQGFKLPFKFLPGEAYRRLPVEKITVRLPLKDKSGGSVYTVMVGFQLTPEQIAFNRSAHPQ